MDLQRIKNRHLGSSTRRWIYEGKLQSYLDSGMDVYDLCLMLGFLKDDAILILELQEMAKRDALIEYFAANVYFSTN